MVRKDHNKCVFCSLLDTLGLSYTSHKHKALTLPLSMLGTGRSNDSNLFTPT